MFWYFGFVFPQDNVTLICVYFDFILKQFCLSVGTCSNVICVKGQMCIVERTRASCVCPKACLNELDPVCSHFLVEYQNLCELHKFACKHELSIGVSSKGPCDVNGEWMVAYQRSWITSAHFRRFVIDLSIILFWEGTLMWIIETMFSRGGKVPRMFFKDAKCLDDNIVKIDPLH